jgi:hypothetical protein
VASTVPPLISYGKTLTLSENAAETYQPRPLIEPTHPFEKDWLRFIPVLNVEKDVPS